MCGIYGQFNFRDGAPVVDRELRQATRTIAHRGPDDEGFYLSGPIGLGFRRLSIIDLAGGHQPMTDQQRTVWVVFNGEIYNFAELRAQPEARGHVFQTRSDTEVLVHGYKEWGEDLFDHLNGMFGVAIWDERAQKLVLARDAMGIKPVYYRLDAGSIFFGSEIRPLLCGDYGIDVDPAARQRGAAVVADLDGHLVGGAADALGLDLEDGGDVAHRRLEDVERLAARAATHLLEGVVDDLLRDALLAPEHHAVDELRGQDGLVDRIRHRFSLAHHRPSRHDL